MPFCRAHQIAFEEALGAFLACESICGVGEESMDKIKKTTVEYIYFHLFWFPTDGSLFIPSQIQAAVTIALDAMAGW